MMRVNISAYLFEIKHPRKIPVSTRWSNTIFINDVICMECYLRDILFYGAQYYHRVSIR